MLFVPLRALDFSKQATIVAACLLNAACSLPASTDGVVGEGRRAQVQRICTETMQLDPGNVHSEDCVAVLSDEARRVELAGGRP